MLSAYQIRVNSRATHYPHNEIEEAARVTKYVNLYGSIVAAVKVVAIEKRIVHLLSYEDSNLDAKIRANMAARTRILLKAERGLYVIRN